MISCLVIRMPCAPIRTIRRSNARLPSSIGCPSTSNWRARGSTQNRPNRMTASPLTPASCGLELGGAPWSLGCATCRKTSGWCMTPASVIGWLKVRDVAGPSGASPDACDERLLRQTAAVVAVTRRIAPREVVGNWTNVESGQQKEERLLYFRPRGLRLYTRGCEPIRNIESRCRERFGQPGEFESRAPGSDSSMSSVARTMNSTCRASTRITLRFAE